MTPDLAITCAIVAAPMIGFYAVARQRDNLRARWMLDGALKARRQAAINARRLAEANLPAQQDLFA